MLRLLLLLAAVLQARAFAPAPRRAPSTCSSVGGRCIHRRPLHMAGDAESAEEASTMSLEEKMKSWEASEEEIKAASLGGITAGSKSGTDGFDVGLWAMFPFIVATSLLFFVFPFIKDSIDVSSVGPPPMV